MKKLFLYLVFALVGISSYSQTNQSLNLKNANNNLFRYGYEAVLTTTDSGTYTIATLPIASNEGGIITVDVVGTNTANGASCTGIQNARYSKASGTLTLGTPANLSAKVTDGGLSGATWAITTSSNNVIVTVTGDTATTVKWIANVRWINRK